jgi:DNA-binding transcriptional ArsR family regulator
MRRDPIQPQRCAKLFAALAAPERLRIIRFLQGGPRNVTEVAEMLRTAPVNVSHHLKVLKEARVVRGKKRGRFVLYSLAPGFLCADPQTGKEHLDLGCCRVEVPPRPDDPPEPAGA